METRPKVFFEVAIDGEVIGRIIFQLYSDITPKTAENFRALCTGEKGIDAASGKELSYKNCPFHRIIPNFMIQGGDFTRQNGTGGVSIYGEKFPDENFIEKHSRAGLLSMANSGPGTNGSQFFITTTETPHLDGKHVVFGEVISGMRVVLEMEEQGSSDGATKRKVSIANCGELKSGEEATVSTDDGLADWPEEDADLTAGLAITAATSLKELGNTYFKAGNLPKAISKYSKALRYLAEPFSANRSLLNTTPEEMTTCVQLQCTMLLNRAQCNLKVQPLNAKAVIDDTSVVIGKTGADAASKVKAYYRRSQAHGNDEDAAMADLQAAKTLEPSNASVLADLKKLKEKQDARKEQQKKVFAKMFA